MRLKPVKDTSIHPGKASRGILAGGLVSPTSPDKQLVQAISPRRVSLQRPSTSTSFPDHRIPLTGSGSSMSNVSRVVARVVAAAPVAVQQQISRQPTYTLVRADNDGNKPPRTQGYVRGTMFDIFSRDTMKVRSRVSREVQSAHRLQSMYDRINHMQRSASKGNTLFVYESQKGTEDLTIVWDIFDDSSRMQRFKVMIVPTCREPSLKNYLGTRVLFSLPIADGHIVGVDFEEFFAKIGEGGFHTGV